MASFGGILSQIQGMSNQARAENLKRYNAMMDIYDEIVARSKPGGAFEKRGLETIARAKVKGVGEETQQLISSGLFGTTTMAGAGRRWDADVGMPARGKLEDIMEERHTSAQLAKAGAMERREDEYPDYGLLASLAMQAAPSQTQSPYQMPKFGSSGTTSPSSSFSSAQWSGSDTPSSSTGYGMTPAERAAHFAKLGYGTGHTAPVTEPLAPATQPTKSSAGYGDLPIPIGSGGTDPNTKYVIQRPGGANYTLTAAYLNTMPKGHKVLGTVKNKADYLKKYGK